MAIGWLELGHEFRTGTVARRLLEKLASLRLEFVGSSFPGTTCRGLHACSLCKNNEPLSESHINLFVPTVGFVYVSPGRIDHYIETHGYSPPEHYVDAVLQCRSPTSAEYRALLCAANRGYDAPLFGDLAQ
jgi:hypothetical protein